MFLATHLDVCNIQIKREDDNRVDFGVIIKDVSINGYSKNTNIPYTFPDLSKYLENEIIPILNQNSINLNILRIFLTNTPIEDLLKCYMASDNRKVRCYLLTALIPRLLNSSKPVYLKDKKLNFYDNQTKQYMSLTLGALSTDDVHQDFAKAFKLLAGHELPKIAKITDTVKPEKNLQDENEELKQRIKQLEEQLQSSENNKKQTSLNNNNNSPEVITSAGTYKYANRITFFGGLVVTTAIATVAVAITMVKNSQ